MKLVAIYKKSIQREQRIYPREIRNYIASITQEDKEVHEELMAHKRVQPTFIFSMPNHKSFAIYTFKDDPRSKAMLRIIQKRIEENPHINIKGVVAEVERSYTTVYDFTKFEVGRLYERSLRTPMIIAANVAEYAQCRALTEGEGDIEGLKKYVIGKIRETVSLMARDWFNGARAEFIAEIMNNAVIAIKDLEYFPLEYKENEYYPAVRATIMSDVNLPQYLGYKTGMGYGELSRLKEMDRHRKAQQNHSQKESA